MITIHKYPIGAGGIEWLHFGSRVLCVDVQRNEICMWVECNPTQSLCKVEVFVIGTGHPVPAEAVNYIGTVLMGDGDFVFHVYTGAIPS